jgi:retinol dehydrogenase 14
MGHVQGPMAGRTVLVTGVTSIHSASAPELEQVSGQYFSGRRPTRSTTRSYDQAVATQLWEASADLVRLAAAPRV